MLFILSGFGYASEPLSNDTLYAVASDSLYTIDVGTGSATAIGPIKVSNVTDIAFNGKALYGVTFNSFLVINAETGVGNVIGLTGFPDLNALAISSDGSIYTAGSLTGNLVKINPQNGIGINVGNYGPGLTSSGDLVFDSNGNLYASVNRQGFSNDWLAKINIATGSATLIGNIGYDNVFGLTFKDNYLYGVTDSGNLIKIDVVDGAGTLIGSNGLALWGLSTLELPVSAPVIILNTQLSLKASPKTIYKGKAVTIKGQLKDASGKPVAGKTVVIKANGKVIKRVKTNAGGVFKFKHKPKKTTKYQASYAGDTSYKASSSNAAKVVVKKAKKKKK